VDNVQNLVATQFRVRPYHTLFSFLHSCIQLYRHLLCILSLVWLILFFIYFMFLTTIWIAILICLEHSFWIVQQGSNSNDGFMEAWKFYLKTQHILVDQELGHYLRSIGSNDWFTMKYRPSEAECAECRKIVLNNLLRKSNHWSWNCWSIYLQPILKPPLDYTDCWIA